MIKLVAIVENPQQRENLRQCINILGVAPCIHKDVVCMHCSEQDVQMDKFIELFEQYPRHEIRHE